MGYADELMLGGMIPLPFFAMNKRALTMRRRESYASVVPSYWQKQNCSDGPHEPVDA